MTYDTHQMTYFRQINGPNCNSVLSFLDDDKTFNENLIPVHIFPWLLIVISYKEWQKVG